MGEHENVAREEHKTKAEVIQLYFEDSKEKKSIAKAIKNGILSCVTIISCIFIVNCVGAWENDVTNMIPYIIQAVIGLVWLLIFGYANRDELIYRD